MRIDHVAAVAEQSAAFTEAVTRPGALQRKVAACPDWTVADLDGDAELVAAFLAWSGLD